LREKVLFSGETKGREKERKLKKTANRKSANPSTKGK